MNNLRFAMPANHTWQWAVHWFFVLLFAFVLPFICWGVLETPGHAHGAVHFVFQEPPGANVSAKAAMRKAILASWCGTTADAKAWERASVDDVEPVTAATPAGRSVPSTANSAIPLLVDTASSMVVAEFPTFSATVTHFGFHSIDLSVPTPPPRATA